jgi:N-acetyl-anhydromuramyl-L-alanine amidase AmpD
MKLTRVLKRGIHGKDVKYMQSKLSTMGYVIFVSGDFDSTTEKSVKKYQKEHGLSVDGVVGTKTWYKMFGSVKSTKNFPYKVSETTDLGLDIYEKLLPSDEYVKKKYKKCVIYIHHTAGSHRADWNIATWGKDRTRSGKKKRVATAYVIGGKSTSDGDTLYDGKVFRAFDDMYSAFHLGIKDDDDSVELNYESIGIEVCNYGWVKYVDGSFINYVGREIPKEDVVDLGYEFRGFRYWHKYTDSQLESLRKLILYLSDKYDIEVRGSYDADWFEFDERSLDPGYNGLRTHTNCRRDKYDMSPQQNLIDMLNKL